MSDRERDNPTRRFAIRIGIIIVAAVLVISLVAGIKFIPAGSTGVKTVNGAVAGTRDSNGNLISYDKPLLPGVHFVTPFIENIQVRETRTQVYYQLVQGASKDVQDVNATVAITYSIDPNQVPELFDKTSFDVEGRIFKAATDGISKSVMPAYTAEEIVQKRPSLVKDIDENIHSRLETRGVIIEAIDLTQVTYRQEFSTAVENKVIAQQDAQKAENEVKISEANAQKQIAEANGQAQAIKVINDQLKNSPDYVKYLLAQKWDGHLPLVAGSGATPLINVQDLMQRPN